METRKGEAAFRGMRGKLVTNQSAIVLIDDTKARRHAAKLLHFWSIAGVLRRPPPGVIAAAVPHQSVQPKPKERLLRNRRLSPLRPIPERL